MKIIFVKHGKSSFKTDKLTLQGKLQIKAVAHYLKNEKIDAIFCAPEIRTLQSSKMLEKAFKTPVYIVKEFGERTLLPQKFQNLKDDFEKHYLSFNYQNENFESCNQYLKRVFLGFNQILEQENSFNTVVIVAHSSTLCMLNAFINGIPKDNQIKWLQLNSGAVIKFFAKQRFDLDKL